MELLIVKEIVGTSYLVVIFFNRFPINFTCELVNPWKYNIYKERNISSEDWYGIRGGILDYWYLYKNTGVINNRDS